jgi:hypothetical protein
VGHSSIRDPHPAALLKVPQSFGAGDAHVLLECDGRLRTNVVEELVQGHALLRSVLAVEQHSGHWEQPVPLGTHVAASPGQHVHFSPAVPENAQEKQASPWWQLPASHVLQSG